MGCIVSGCFQKTNKQRCYKHQLIHKYGEEEGVKKFNYRYEQMKKRAIRRRQNKSQKTWIGDDGMLWQKCCYDAWGSCHSPCNGDC